ncbi:MAG: hypothetical protein QXL85_08255 [Candidatus Bathyarchaeia archaeon]
MGGFADRAVDRECWVVWVVCCLPIFEVWWEPVSLFAEPVRAGINGSKP